ncbi:MAG: class I SAM-dependent methyltransferase [Desulfobacterales bacterium]
MLDEKLLNAHLKLACKPDPEDICLDLCCGPGIVGKIFQTNGWQVIGIDLTQEMVEVAERYFPAIQGGIESMPFPDDYFSMAVLRQSFMLTQGEAALTEIQRVIKNNGHYIFSQSFAFGPEDEEQYRKIQEARHINMTRYYTASDLFNELYAYGFIVEQEEALRVRESVDHWLNSAPELSDEKRCEIRELIRSAPSTYKAAHRVEEVNGELFEDWSWRILRARVNK